VESTIIHHDYQAAAEALEREMWRDAREWGAIAREDVPFGCNGLPATQAIRDAAENAERMAWPLAQRCGEARELYDEIRDRPLAEVVFIMCVQGYPEHACYILSGDWSQGDIEGSYFA
jgi:hypothetical protein